MEPVTILAWVNVILEAGKLTEKLIIIGKRLQAGEDVTQEELDRAKAETDAAVAAWDAAPHKEE